MNRFLPAPLLSAVLFFVWPLLNQSWTLGQLSVGALLAVSIPWFTEALRPEKVSLRQPLLIVRLGLVVLRDIVKSNIDVAKGILGPEREIQPGFVWLPLSIRDPHGIVALAGIITMTPGTLSSELTEDLKQGLLIYR